MLPDFFADVADLILHGLVHVGDVGQVIQCVQANGQAEQRGGGVEHQVLEAAAQLEVRVRGVAFVIRVIGSPSLVGRVRRAGLLRAIEHPVQRIFGYIAGIGGALGFYRRNMEWAGMKWSLSSSRLKTDTLSGNQFFKESGAS